MKTCTKCGNEYPATNEFFNKDKSSKSGLCTQCKECRRADYKSKYDIFKIKKRIYRQLNAEKIKQRRKNWLKIDDNREKTNLQQKIWLEKNKESYKKWKDEWREINKDKIYMQAKEWKKNNPYRVKWMYLKFRYDLNTPPLQEVIDLFKKYENPNGTYRCEYCNCELTFKETTYDHKIPISKGGDNSIDNLAISCAKCNMKKGTKPLEEFLNTTKARC